jgi:hypothetical protein
VSPSSRAGGDTAFRALGGDTLYYARSELYDEHTDPHPLE